MGYITFNDGADRILHATPAGPPRRLCNWVTLTRPIGAASHRQSDGARTMVVTRTQYGASFELRHLSVREIAAFYGNARMSEVADRLVAHLLRGNACTVVTEDVDNNVYTCSLMPGTEPQLALADPRNLEYTLSLSLISSGGAAMVCHYRDT